MFVTEARFTKGKNNMIYGDISFNYSLWKRYLTSFDKIYVFARVKKDKNFTSNSNCLSSGINVEFIELPYYLGPAEYLKKYFSIKKLIRKEVHKLSACKFICRIPGVIGNLVIGELLKQNIRYAVEVVGDPEDVFAPGTIKHPLRAYFRRKAIKSLKSNIKNSGAVLYVTKSVLQNKYPPAPAQFNIFASNVKLQEEFLTQSPLKWQNKTTYEIISIGSLDQLYKAPDVLIEALKILNNNNVASFHLKWLGDGKYLQEIIDLAESFKIIEKIEFLGNVDKEKVYDYLKKSDLFVLASRTEGLPRAVIEAMSIGLPAVGTNVGGIPELLDKEVLVEKNDAIALANKILDLLTNEDFYNIQAERNFSESSFYLEHILNKKRTAFYQYIIENL